MKNKKLLLIGGGGNCKSVIDSLYRLKEYGEIGIVDISRNIGNQILDIDIIGCDGDLRMLYKKGYQYAFVTIGSVGDPSLRIRLFNQIEEIGFKIPNIIDTSAIVSEHTNMDKGIYVGKGAVINAGSSIGKGVIINTAAIIEHDCIIESFVHISPGAVLCGNVQVGRNTHVGACSVVKQQVKIGSNTLIGVGSAVVCDMSDDVTAYGNPCKEIISK